MAPEKWPLNFEVIAKCSKSKARAGILKLPHGDVETPVFMPVGTYGTIKGILPDDVSSMGYQILLGNTYHLGLKPGLEVISRCNGLHKFMNWNRNILTDSGGFQIVSLSKLVTITEGVLFNNPTTDTQCLLTPEESIKIQMTLGSDIMMQLDDVVPSTTTGPRVEEAMLRSIRWLDRCIETIPYTNSTQNLFPIIQGGLDKNLRQICIYEMKKRNIPGFAIGGLSGGEEKSRFCEIVSFCTDNLPFEKPRYLMGVGYTLDLIVCTALGCDMYDCVFPTRTARFGSALTRHGSVDLKNTKYKSDPTPIDRDCTCYACENYPKSHLHHLMVNDNSTGSQLITMHNLAFQKYLMNSMRMKIIDGSFDAWVIDFIKRLCEKDETIPKWAVNALKTVNIHLD